MHTLGSVTTKRKYCKRKQLPSRRIQAMHFLAIISSFKSFIEGKRVSFQKRILFLFNWCVLPRKMYVNNELRKKCLYLEIFWSAFPPRSPPDPEYGERERERETKYSVRMQENIDQNNFEYGHFSRIVEHQMLRIYQRRRRQILS